MYKKSLHMNMLQAYLPISIGSFVLDCDVLRSISSFSSYSKVDNAAQ